MSTPVLSVYVPVYNVEKHLEQCLESILGQTFSDFELYIYNDGSTDNSFAICQKFAERDGRLILQTGKNGGFIEKMNEFIKTARGQYIGFVDSDDYLAEDYFQKMMDPLLKTNADGAVSSYTLVSYEEDVLPWYTPKLRDGEILSREQMLRKFLTTLDIEGFRWNKVYKKSLFLENEIFFPNYNPEDILTEFLLLCHVEKTVMVDTGGYHYRQSSASRASTPSAGKIINFLKIFQEVSKIADVYGLEKESRYYRTWRSINTLFLTWKDRKRYPAEEWDKLCKQCNWRTILNIPLSQALKTVCKFKNEKDSFVKFAVKTVIVWCSFR